MEQIVRIKKCFADGTAQVVCIRESACSGECHKCAGCGAAKEAILLTAVNAIGASSGDLVILQSETAPVLKAAMVLYMLPLAMFFAGYAAGAALGISGALAGGMAFAASIALIVIYDRRMAKKNTATYTITGYAGSPFLQSIKKGDHDRG